MFLRAQYIDDNDDGVGRVRRTCGLRNDDGGVGRGRGKEYAYEGLEKPMEWARIWGQRRRLQRRNDRPEKLATTTEASVEEDYPEVSTKTTDASAEESEEKKLPSERLQQQKRRCVYGLKVLTTMKTALAE